MLFKKYISAINNIYSYDFFLYVHLASVYHFLNSPIDFLYSWLREICTIFVKLVLVPLGKCKFWKVNAKVVQPENTFLPAYKGALFSL